MIGNFPQAFSHIGLINAAWAITQAQQPTRARLSAAAASNNPAGPLVVPDSCLRPILDPPVPGQPPSRTLFRRDRPRGRAAARH
jgi:hypothetical protein